MLTAREGVVQAELRHGASYRSSAEVRGFYGFTVFSSALRYNGEKQGCILDVSEATLARSQG